MHVFVRASSRIFVLFNSTSVMNAVSRQQRIPVGVLVVFSTVACISELHICDLVIAEDLSMQACGSVLSSLRYTLGRRVSRA